MKPIIILSLLALGLVIAGAVAALFFISTLPAVEGYGNWPFYMLAVAIVIVIGLAALYSALMYYSARHHDHKVFKPEDFEHWND